MHEISLIKNLLEKLNSIAEENKGSLITEVSIKLGALSHISEEHFKEHYLEWIKGNPAENAVLKIETSGDYKDPMAQDIVLESVVLETNQH